VFVTELTLPALFAAGLGSSVHCALMCGSVGAWPLSNRANIPRSQALILIHGGRFIGYTALGALAGGIGSQLILLLPDQRWGQVLQIAAALALLATGFMQLRATSNKHQKAACCTSTISWLRRVPPHVQLFVRGVMWAAMPCGILYGMLALSSMSGSAWTGSALLGAFALGTVPILGASNATFSVLPHLRGSQSLRYAAAIFLLSLGCASLIVILSHSSAVIAWCHATI
jgi:hypothetical protein